MTRVRRTFSKVAASPNVMSSVSSNGPAFLLLQALAMSRSLGMGLHRLVFDRKHLQRIARLHHVAQRELVDRAALDVGGREREGHVALLAEPAGEIGMQKGYA